MVENILVKSGNGYFCRFVNESPEMHTDPAFALLMSRTDAEAVIDKLNQLGLYACSFLVEGVLPPVCTFNFDGWFEKE